MKNERNYSIELLRIVFMYSLCVEHSISQGGFYRPGLDHVLDVAVDGFMFISGYYGIKFSFKKIGGMLALAAWCAFVLNFARIFIIGDRTFATLVSSTAYTIAHSTGWWFFWSYLVVMCLAPLVGAAFDSLQGGGLKEASKVVAPVMILCFGWNYLSVVPVVKDFVPSPLGFGNPTFLTLLGVYVFARTYRIFGFERFLTRKILLALSPIGVALVWFGSWHHNSIPQLLLATIVFRAFSMLSLPQKASRIVAYAAPSMFAVYLLHVSGVGYFLMNRCNTFLVEGMAVPAYLSYFVTGAVVFVLAFTVDVVRRMAICWGKKGK